MMPPKDLLKFDSRLEISEDDEPETAAELVRVLLKISETTYADEGRALRSVHAKSHGLLQGTLTVADGLPPELAQGIFSKPASYKATARLSTSPGDILPDNVSTPRGFALKIRGVEGARLDGAEQEPMQDFLLIDGKAFVTPTAKQFLGSLKLLAATTDKSVELKQVVSAALRGLETVLEIFGSESPTVVALGGHSETHMLGSSYFSQVPIRYGDYIAKIGLYPVSAELMKLTNASLNVNNQPDGLRQAVREFFAANSGQWELKAQLCTNIKDMPIEEASALWSEQESPYLTIARLDIPKQNSWSEEKYNAIDMPMMFSPWNGVDLHQPLGSIMRVRKRAYKESAKFRLKRNGCPFSGSSAIPPKGFL